MRHTEFFRNDGDGNGGTSGNNQQQSLQGNTMRMTMNNGSSGQNLNGLRFAGGGQQQQQRNHFQVHELVSFVNQHILVENPMTVKQMQNPSTRQFSQVFWGLIKILDPLTKPDGMTLDEIPQLMKFWNYPHTLNKNMFVTLGAPHTWHHLQTLLVWLFQVAKELKNIAHGGEQQLSSQSQNEPGNSSSDKQKGKSDMEILNGFIARSFKRRECSWNSSSSQQQPPSGGGGAGMGGPYSKGLNSSKKNRVVMQSGEDDEREEKEIADLLKARNVQMNESMREQEVKIETMKLANKNLCAKQPELQEINSKIEQQLDIINMEQEMLTELQAKHEAELKEVEALSNQFNNKLLEIHELGLERKRIQQQVEEQEYSKSEAEKKIKEIDRLRAEREQMERVITECASQRHSMYSLIDIQLAEINSLVMEYNNFLHSSSQIFLQCQDFQLQLSQERLHAETVEQLTEGCVQEIPSQSSFDALLSSKHMRKQIIRNMVNVDLNQTKQKLQQLSNEYSNATREREETLKITNSAIEQIRNEIIEIELHENQLKVKITQKQNELNSLTQSLTDRQTTFKTSSADALNENALLNSQIAALTSQQTVLEISLSSLMNSCETKRERNVKLREEASAIVDAQLPKLINLKAQVQAKLTDLNIKLNNLHATSLD